MVRTAAERRGRTNHIRWNNTLERIMAGETYATRTEHCSHNTIITEHITRARRLACKDAARHAAVMCAAELFHLNCTPNWVNTHTRAPTDRVLFGPRRFHSLASTVQGKLL